MMYKVINYFFLMIFGFTSVTACNSMDNKYIPARYVVIADEIMAEMMEKLPKRHCMRVIGTTGGLANFVNVLGLSFQIQGPLSQDQLRAILIDCVEEFLSALNSNEEIRPYLKTYPFTSKGIDIMIFVVDKSGREVLHPFISTASAIKGCVSFTTTDPEDKYKYKTEVEETYEEALKKVREQQQ